MLQLVEQLEALQLAQVPVPRLALLLEVRPLALQMPQVARLMLRWVAQQMRPLARAEVRQLARLQVPRVARLEAHRRVPLVVRVVARRARIRRCS